MYNLNHGEKNGERVDERDGGWEEKEILGLVDFKPLSKRKVLIYSIHAIDYRP